MNTSKQDSGEIVKASQGGEVRVINPIMKFFEYEHLPAHLQVVSKPIGELAKLMDYGLLDSEEKNAGLRKLLEAKDCLVRAALEKPKG